MAFNLASISKGKNIKAPRIFLYASHGIGKSSFCAKAPNPIFINVEDGIGELDVASFPLVKSSADIMSAIATLYTEAHEFQSCVLDSADWTEQILQREIETNHDAKELAYGKGSLILADKWKQILDGLNALRNDKGMSILITGHAEIKRFDSPEVEPYDRYQPRLQARSSALIQEFCDAVFFANFRTLIKKDEVGFNKTNNRGLTTGERLMYTQETPAYLAKNRFSLPTSLPLEWNSFANAMATSIAS